MIAALLIMMGCMGISRRYAANYRGRIRKLAELEHILELLSGEVRYGNATLPEACTHISAHVPGSIGTAFQRVEHRMKGCGGCSFEEVFRQECMHVLEDGDYLAEDRDTFMEFASQTGFSDCQMQLQVIERSRRKLEGTRQHLIEEASNKNKMATSFGVMSGLLLVIILW